MSTELVRWSKSAGVATIVLDHPPLNVMCQALVRDLEACLSATELDDEVLAVVLAGSGPAAFMAGADIVEVAGWLDHGGGPNGPRRSRGVIARVAEFPKPTIAAVEGYCLGGGCELALACDIRVAGESAQFGLPEVKLGLIPGGGGTQRLTRLVGEARAKELMYLGDPIPCAEALRIGLVNQTVPDGEALPTARTLAARIAGRAGAALRAVKEAVDYARSHSLYEGLTFEAELFDQLLRTDTAREGVSAFLAKRKPAFRNGWPAVTAVSPDTPHGTRRR